MTSDIQAKHDKQWSKIGMIARWRPVHRGHVVVLQALCEHAEQAIIGIGSANRYNVRNPFTLDEASHMLKLALTEWDNYTLLPIPDLDDGPRWREMVAKQFGKLDVFVTDNPYVADLLKDTYTLVRPITLIPSNEQIPINGTMVRLAMAKGVDWQSMMTDDIATYITTEGLDDRFRHEFGLQTLVLDTMIRRTD